MLGKKTGSASKALGTCDSSRATRNTVSVLGTSRQGVSTPLASKPQPHCSHSPSPHLEVPSVWLQWHIGGQQPLAVAQQGVEQGDPKLQRSTRRSVTAGSSGTPGVPQGSALLRTAYLVLQGHGEGELRGLGQKPGQLLQDLDEFAEGHSTHHLVQRAVEHGKRLGRAEGRAGI